MRTRPGTDALIVTDPVEVAPKDPCVDAAAGAASRSAADAPASRAPAKRFIIVDPHKKASEMEVSSTT
jgi:hypothetical protein